MNSEKILKVLDIYEKFFKEKGYEIIDYPHDELLSHEQVGLDHCYSMIDKMRGFIQEGRLEKTFRWLGFIQGCLWMAGIYTLEDLMDHNRPRGE